ncbi:hypothetical protein B0T25DRAFT_571663 [Lasiosphaeria hispida]|uniref:Uncharacterized protein n=1 Tax=Lasiosphaeria hispida TaxID=260671 RepID=A0AAJ0MAW6_9PEZI|nr:hypothetical protein B0T25DRAFT_571663 [Lasiosphaeria hispida]
MDCSSHFLPPLVFSMPTKAITIRYAGQFEEIHAGVKPLRAATEGHFSFYSSLATDHFEECHSVVAVSFEEEGLPALNRQVYYHYIDNNDAFWVQKSPNSEMDPEAECLEILFNNNITVGDEVAEGYKQTIAWSIDLGRHELTILKALLMQARPLPATLARVAEMPRDEREVLYYNLRASMMEQPVPKQLGAFGQWQKLAASGTPQCKPYLDRMYRNKRLEEWQRQERIEEVRRLRYYAQMEVPPPEFVWRALDPWSLADQEKEFVPSFLGEQGMESENGRDGSLRATSVALEEPDSASAKSEDCSDSVSTDLPSLHDASEVTRTPKPAGKPRPLSFGQSPFKEITLAEEKENLKTLNSGVKSAKKSEHTPRKGNSSAKPTKTNPSASGGNGSGPSPSGSSNATAVLGDTTFKPTVRGGHRGSPPRTTSETTSHGYHGEEDEGFYEGKTTGRAGAIIDDDDTLLPVERFHMWDEKSGKVTRMQVLPSGLVHLLAQLKAYNVSEIDDANRELLRTTSLNMRGSSPMALRNRYSDNFGTAKAAGTGTGTRNKAKGVARPPIRPETFMPPTVVITKGPRGTVRAAAVHDEPELEQDREETQSDESDAGSVN